MKWETFKTLINQIDKIITNETDISISAGKMGEDTVEFHTADDEYPIFWIEEGVCGGKKYGSIACKKRLYEE